MKILFIEDEKRMAQALIEILRLEKYEIDYCSEGFSAMETALSNILILFFLMLCCQE